MRTFKGTRFEVEGSGTFPFDMLRFDHCCPETGEDVAAMTKAGRRRVKLMGFTPTDQTNEVTPARWESFLWNVVPDSVKPIE